MAVSRSRWSALRVAVALDALGVLLFFARVPIVLLRGPRQTPVQGFFGEPLAAISVLLAAGLFAGAGVVAAASFIRAPLQSPRGRWAMWLAVASSALLFVFMLGVFVASKLFGYTLPEGVGEPAGPISLLLALVATVLGAIAREPNRRGFLVVPLIIGAFVLTFSVGEVLIPH